MNRGSGLSFTFWFILKLIIKGYIYIHILIPLLFNDVIQLNTFIESDSNVLRNDELECTKKFSWCILFNDAVLSNDVCSVELHLCRWRDKMYLCFNVFKNNKTHFNV